MIYEVRHRTIYEYDYDVLLSHHVVRLAPRESAGQHCLQYRIETSPHATTRSASIDHFGNTATFLTIEGPHRRLEISSRAEVEVKPATAIPPDHTPPWEGIRDSFTKDGAEMPVEPAEFIFASPHVAV
ncbi:MAG: hypothetical protein L0Z50_14085, partial [Verrucomicrobiales bacterium]|nr:hypothetical protein [Verrucomicrobiales bacterium]